MYLKLTKKPNNRTFMQYVESYSVDFAPTGHPFR